VLAGVLAGLAAGALWGLVFVVPLWLPQWPAIDLAAGRLVAFGMVSAGILAGTWVARPRQAVATIGANLRARAGEASGPPPLLPTARQCASALGLAFLGFWGYYTLLVLALRDAGPEVPTLIIGTIPLWVMVLGKPGHVRWRVVAPGLALTAAGLAVMLAASGPGDGTGPVAGVPAQGQTDFWRGVALACVAMASWTVFALLNARWLRRHPEVGTTAWANWLGLATGVGAFSLWMVAGSPASEILQRPGLGLFLVLCAGTGFGSAWLATVLWNTASRRLSPSLCGQLIVSETLFALLYAFLLETRWPTPAQGLACILFTLGILASVRAQRT
jgi:drug/metabolite transporter (DMT)-like permease